MAYRSGEQVLISALGRVGEIVEIEKDGVYKVTLGNMTMRCRESELRPATKPPKKSKSVKAAPLVSVPSPRARSVVDLHGLTVAEAIHVIDSALNRAALDGVREVDFIHGIGGGKLKEALLARLQSIPVVSEVKTGTPNPGVTRVYLDS